MEKACKGLLADDSTTYSYHKKNYNKTSLPSIKECKMQDLLFLLFILSPQFRIRRGFLQAPSYCRTYNE